MGIRQMSTGGLRVDLLCGCPLLLDTRWLIVMANYSCCMLCGRCHMCVTACLDQSYAVRQ
jgi:hypothetical protein